MAFSTIEVHTEGALGGLTLNRPEKLNPLSLETLEELAEAARWFDERPEIKVVVVSGRGRAFSSGADVSSFAQAPDDDRAPREAADAGRVMAEAVESMKAVTIASIHGHCVGGGVVLAGACDLRLAAQSTRFSIPEVDLGIPLAWGGIPRLVREIGPAMTKELVLSCRPFTAEEGQTTGLHQPCAPRSGAGGRRRPAGGGTRRKVLADPHGDEAGRQCRKPGDGLDGGRLERRRHAAGRVLRRRISAGGTGIP